VTGVDKSIGATGDTMNVLRLIRSNKTYADFSTNIAPAIERAMEERLSENTVVLNIFSQDSFTVGFLDDPEKCLNLDYCKQKNIVVRRRKNPGGAVFGAKGSAIICLYLDTRLPLIPIKTIKDTFPFFLTRFSDTLNTIFELNTSYRPLNDIEINGRKLVATSAKLENDILTMRVLLNVCPTNRNILNNAVIAHAEKFKDKKIKSVGQRFTCLEEEIGRTIKEPDFLHLTTEFIEKIFGKDVELSFAELSDIEQKYAIEQQKEYTSEEWFYANSERERFKTIPSDTIKIEGLHKAQAGLIRVTLLLINDRIYDIIITGDFHPTPYKVLNDMENSLRGKKIDIEEIKNELGSIYNQPNVDITGTTMEDFILPFKKAFQQIH